MYGVPQPGFNPWTIVVLAQGGGGLPYETDGDARRLA